MKDGDLSWLLESSIYKDKFLYILHELYWLKLEWTCDSLQSDRTDGERLSLKYQFSTTMKN